MVIISTRDVLLLGGLLAKTSLGQLFTVNCAPLTVFRGDPIVNPGVLSSHVHAVVGGTRFDLTLSNEQARNARATTCDKTMDKSNYWQPQLYHQRRDGKFELVEMTGIVCWPPLSRPSSLSSAVSASSSSPFLPRDINYPKWPSVCLDLARLTS